MMEATSTVTAQNANGLSELGMATEAGSASWTLDTLRDERVRNCFLGIFRSDLSSEEKYQKLISYFELLRDLNKSASEYVAPEVLSAPPTGAQTRSVEALEAAPLWRPEETLQRTAENLQRAVQRIVNSQHYDGGWGYEVERSNVWGTAYGLMSLIAAQHSEALAFTVYPKLWDAISCAITRATGWMKTTSACWSIASVPPFESRSIYEASLAVRCMCRAGDTGLPDVTGSIARLAKSQNADGGWDASIWGENITSETKVWSEVGATSMALQALVEGPTQDIKIIERGVEWLIATQNDDGSWNDGSCSPDSAKPRGTPKATKTCDALNGITAARAKGIVGFEMNTNKSASWILRHEKLLRSEDGKTATGWGYNGVNPVEAGYPVEASPDLVSTCLALENYGPAR